MPEAQTLIRGGEIHTDGNKPFVGDVLVRGSNIAAVGPGLRADGAQVIDAAGLIVAPGLIDLHTHVYAGMGIFSIDPARAGIRTGVTTLLDTGSAGSLTYGTFHQYVIPQAREDVFVLLNISAIGVQGHVGIPPCLGDLVDGRWAQVPWAVACVNKHRDRIIGMKVRLTGVLADSKIENEEAGLRGVVEAAAQTGTFVMVHHVMSQIPVVRMLSALRGGDVVTHMYHPHPDHAFDDNTGAPIDAARKARDRGVIFDVGHGVGSFAWHVAEPACQQHNFWPDCISTDIHQFNLDGPVFDLPTTMTKFLHLGMPMPRLIDAVTAAPARAMRLADRFGSLRAGRQADITLLRLTKTPTVLTDVVGKTRTAGQRLVPTHVFKRGDLTSL